MFKKRNLPVLLLVLACGLFVASRTLGIGGKPPSSRYETILKSVGEYLVQVHYSPKAINDDFSREVFKKYLLRVDPEKAIFLQSDIQTLKPFETKLDDELLNGTVQFVPAVTEIFKKRIAETEKLYKELLSQPFDFSKDETGVFDADKIDFAKNETERKEVYRKRMKYLVLDRYVDMLEAQEKSKGKQGYVAKTDVQMEKEARDRVRIAMDRLYNRYKFKINDDDRFSDYVNTITSTMDPHTDFFLPVDKRSFDESMSGKFYGIGAALKEEDGVIKITTLITGSPAWKSGQIVAGDIIQKVAEGAGDPVDLTGYVIEDAVKLIRGQKGTEVRLTLKKVDGAVKVVSLIRDEIVQDETFARSVIVNNGKSKLGYIFLPEFYADFENPKGEHAHCAIDVQKELIKLKMENVDGIVLDLRNNGGGSLYDVVQMVGLFINEGPVVQVRDRNGKAGVLDDKDKSVLYDGPLAVMVNEFSASASEIFAAAIQDYKRGIIIGSTTTYGKGTVQRPIGLGGGMDFASANSDLGTLKITLQKFYRINGGSTQLKGVASDIVLPDLYEHSKLREKDDSDALPWDEIKPVNYTPWKNSFDLPAIRSASTARLANNEAFKLISTKTEWLAKENDKTFPLKLDKFRQEKKAINDAYKQLEGLNKLSPQELNVASITGEENKYASDTAKAERLKAWMKSLRNDIYLNEAVNVVDDMVAEKNVVKAH